MLRFLSHDAVPTDDGIHTSAFAYTNENYLHTLPPFHVSSLGIASKHAERGKLLT